MRFFKRSIFYRKKYFIRIVLSISFVAILLVGALTLALYVYGKQTLSRIEAHNNIQVLNQVRFNFELMDSTVKNTAKYLFVNSDTTAILNSTGNMDSDDIYNRLNRVTSSVISSNSFIQSIGFYNEYQRQYYYAGKQMYYDDAGMKQMIADYPHTPRMKPIFRSINNTFGKKVVKETIITYLLYQASGDPAKIDAAVAINVNSDWIRDNLNHLNMVNSKLGESAYIYSDTSGFLDSSKQNANLQQALLTEYNKESPTDQDNLGSFERKLDNNKYVVTYLRLKDQGLTIFKIQPTSVVYQSLHAFGIFLLIIFIIFLLLALIFSILVSGIVYNPIQRLVSQVTGIADKNHENDEISFLSTIYKESMTSLKKYDSEKQNYSSIMKTYFIKNMLTGELQTSREKFESTCREYALPFQYDGDYYICLVQIDEFARFEQSFSQNDRNLLKYALLNVCTESLIEVSQVEGVDMHENDIVLIIPCNSPSLNVPEALENAMKKAQYFMLDYCKISFSASLSSVIHGVEHISAAYRALLADAYYRFIFGHGSFITPERFKLNSENRNTTHSQKLESALLDNINQGNMSGIKQSLKLIQDELTTLSYENMTIALLHLLNAIRNKLILNEKHASLGNGNGVLEILKSLGSYETIEECFNKLLFVLDAIFNGNKLDESPNQNIVLEAAYNIIHLTFAENTLCADLIASKLNLHPRRLAKIFKDGTGMSVADYINEYRMKKAASMLESSNLSVYDVILKVGYENESYFYKMFKARYGMTPKEYSTKFN